MRYEAVPKGMRERPQWVVAGTDKVPLNPKTLANASPTDPDTWATFDEACAHTDKFIGFVFTEDDPYVGIDLDRPQNKEQEKRHALLIEHFATYAEVSMSGQGVHLICEGQLRGSGMRRDKVEVYDRDRYFIVTGRALNGKGITPQQDMLDILSAEMSRGAILSSTEMADGDQTMRDSELFDMASTANNGDKFLKLIEGDWQHDYPSQSEADYALMNHLAFYSRNNEQCRRVFGMTALGKRPKGMRLDYLNRMLARIRQEQNPPVDVSALRNPIQEEKPKPEFKATSKPTPFPEGLIGDLAEYIHASAIRPVREVALAGAIGLVAGLAGRCYNNSNSGLNMYLMLIGGTGIGKEGAAQGINRILGAAKDKLPAILTFRGPGEYASGQALIKVIADRLSMVAVMDEFGHTLSKINRPDATGSDQLWRKVLLAAYNKSGADDYLTDMVYSDQAKNVPSIKSPALTVLGESAPGTFYEAIDEFSIESGLVPRFTLIECPDHRPPANPNAWERPPQELVDRVVALAQTSLAMQANNSVHHVASDPDGAKVLAEFDKEVDTRMNKSKDETLRGIWNRAHMKALRLSALVAVSKDKDNPVITKADAEWACAFCRRDSSLMTKRFIAGTGTGDSVQVAKLREVIRNILGKGRKNKLKQAGVVTHRDLSQRAYKLAPFKRDRLGAGSALKRALDALMDNGELLRLSGQDSKEHFGTGAKCYAVTDEFTMEDE